MIINWTFDETYTVRSDLSKVWIWYADNDEVDLAAGIGKMTFDSIQALMAFTSLRAEMAFTSIQAKETFE